MKYFLSLSLALLLIITGCGSSGTKKQNEITGNESNAVVIGDKINIREKPTIDSKVLGLLRMGDEVTILERDIAGKSNEATLKKDIRFTYEGTDEFALMGNKGRAVKILSYDEQDDSYTVFLYMNGKKVLATVLAGDLLMVEGKSWVKIKTGNGITGYCLQSYIEDKVSENEKRSEKKKKKNQETFTSSDLGYVEYMKRVYYTDGTYDWFYYTAKNLTEQKLGITEKEGFEAVYFLNKPSVVYEIGGSECGFSVTDPQGIGQFYSQIEPHCDLSNYGDD